MTLYVAGCAPAPDHRGSVASGPAGTTPSPPGEGPQGAVSTIAPPRQALGRSEDASQPDTGRLDASRRSQLGLPEPGHVPATPPELTPPQWADPEAAAARFVLVDTNYAAADEPAGVAARRAVYTAPRLAEDLRSSSSGAARLQDLRRQHGVFAGEVLSVVTTKRRDNLAVVAVDARLTLINDGSARDELRSYQLTVSLDSSTGHWLVAGVEES